MQHRLKARFGFGWKENLLAITSIVFLIQIFRLLYWLVDLQGWLIDLQLYLQSWFVYLQNWSRWDWIVANVVVIVVLISLRIGPDLLSNIRSRQQQKATEQGKIDEIKKRKARRLAADQRRESFKRRKF